MTWNIDIGIVNTGSLISLHQELSDIEVCKVLIPSTPANLALVGTDQDVDIDYGGEEIFTGYLTGPNYKVGTNESTVYDKVIVTLAQTELYTGDWTASPLSDAATILADVLAGTGVTVGSCPTTDISVKFNKTPRISAIQYISSILGLDLWTDYISKVYIGFKGGAQFEFKCNENAGTALYDSTTNEQEADLIGGATFVAGKFGYGVNLVSASSQRIETGVLPGTLGATGAWSFVLYVKATAGETGCIVGLRNAATGAIFRVDWDTNAIRVRVTDDAAASIDFTGSDIIADGTFHIIEVVVDPANDRITLYADGAQDQFDATAFAACTFGAIELMYGCYNNNGTPEAYTDVVVDELMFFKEGHNANQAAAFGGLSIHDASILAPQVISELQNDTDRSKVKNYCYMDGVDAYGNSIGAEAYVDAVTGRVVIGSPPGGFVYKPIRGNELSATSFADLGRMAAGRLRPKITEIRQLQMPVRIDRGYNLYTGDFVVIEDTGLVLGDVYRIFSKDMDLTTSSFDVNVLSPDITRTISSLTELASLGIVPGGIAVIPKSSQAFTTSVVFSATDYNTAAWAAGTITFADGTSLGIDAGNSGNLASGYWWVYYTWGQTTLAYTQTEATAIATNKVILAILQVGTDTSQEINISTLGRAKGIVIAKQQLGESSVFAASMREGVQPFDSTISITVNAGAPHTTVDVAAGSVLFGDGSTLAITGPATFGPFADTNLRYVYFTLGSNQLQVTDDIAVAQTDITGLLARIYCSANAAQDMGIQNVKVKFPNFISDFIGAKAIETEHITTKEMWGKDIATQASVGISGGNDGIRILGNASDLVQGPTAIGDAIGGNFAAGIYGFASGPVRKFYLDPANGRIYVWGAGSFRLHRDNAGANQYVGSLDIATYDLGLGSGATAGVKLQATTNMIMLLESHQQWIALDGPNDLIVLDDAWDNMVPQTDMAVGLGRSGATPLRMPYYTPITVIASRPTADIDSVGLTWHTLEVAGGSKTITWQCVENSAAGYEWIQTGIST